MLSCKYQDPYGSPPNIMVPKNKCNTVVALYDPKCYTSSCLAQHRRSKTCDLFRFQSFLHVIAHAIDVASSSKTYGVGAFGTLFSLRVPVFYELEVLRHCFDVLLIRRYACFVVLFNLTVYLCICVERVNKVRIYVVPQGRGLHQATMSCVQAFQGFIVPTNVVAVCFFALALGQLASYDAIGVELVAQLDNSTNNVPQQRLLIWRCGSVGASIDLQIND
jgi:hypothetical protein